MGIRLVWHFNGRFVSSIQIVVWKRDFKKPVYSPKFKWSAKSCDFTIWIPNINTVQYSDESGFQVAIFQMVSYCIQSKNSKS